MPPEDDNETIKEMRTEIKTLSIELRTLQETHKNTVTEREDLKSKLTNLERAKLDEIEQVKLANKDLETKISELTGLSESHEALKSTHTKFSEYVGKLYESKLTVIPEAQRDKLKLVTHVENDPIASLEKLEAVLALGITTGGIKEGTITNTTVVTDGAGSSSTPNKIDPKNVSWNQGLRSKEDLIAEAKKRGTLK